MQLIGQVAGEGRECTATHLQNQALPAGCLELDTRMKCEDNKPHGNVWATKNIHGRWYNWAEDARPQSFCHIAALICVHVWWVTAKQVSTMIHWQIWEKLVVNRGVSRRKYRVSQGAELVQNTAQRPHITAERRNTRDSYWFTQDLHQSLAHSNGRVAKPRLRWEK